MKNVKLDLNAMFVILNAALMIVTFIPVITTVQSSVLMGLIIIVGLIAYSEIKITKSFFELCLFIFVIIVYFLIGKGLSFNTFGLLSWIIRFLSAAVIGLGIYHIKEKHLKYLVYFLICLLIYSNISTIIVSIADPMALRTFGYNIREGYQEYTIANSNLGPIYMYSYGVGEAMAIIAPALLAFCLNIDGIVIKYLGVIAVILSAISQAMAALTASFFLTVIFCAMVILSHLHLTQTKRKFITAIVIFILLFVGSHFFMQVVDNNYLLAEKFGDILSSFRTGNTSGDVSVRNTLIIRSFKAWLSNPVFGWSDIGGLNVNEGVSMHSALFDYLGLYGLFTLLLIDSWRRICAFQLNSLSGKELSYFKWSIISLVILLIVKGPVTIGINFLFSVGFCGFLIRGVDLNSLRKRDVIPD